MINVIIQRGSNDLKWDWYHWLFNDPIYNIIEDYDPIKETDLKTILDHSLIIYSSGNKNICSRLQEYFGKFDGIKYGLYHMAEETPGHNFDHYSKAQIVFRDSWWNELDKIPNVVPTPMGYWSGYQNLDGKIKKASDRKYQWLFCGQYKQDRRDMVVSLNKIGYGYTKICKGFNGNGSHSKDEMKELYQNTVFIPCPKGNINVECYRTYDALEHGCIPIVKKYDGEEYYRNVCGNHPFIVVNDWNDFNPKDIDINNKQEEVYNWYIQFKKELKEDVKRRLVDVLSGKAEVKPPEILTPK